MFQGIFTALITPYKNGEVDETALRKLVDWQIEEGIHGLVPCGTTGESATMSYDMHERVTEIVVEQAAGRVPVIAGAGSNSTWEAIKLNKHDKQAGADGSLQITPYYNKPTQEGMYQHFKAVAQSADIPIVLYNVPSRTGVNLLPETVKRLCEIKNIVALKDAAGDIKQTLDTIVETRGQIDIFSGDDFANLPIISIGGKGAISVSANIAPAQCAELYNAWEDGDTKKAAKIQQDLHEINRCMFLETNPIPVK